MFEFNGTLSQKVADDYRKSLSSRRKRNGIIIFVVTAVLLVLALLMDIVIFQDKTPFPNLLFKDWILFFVVLFLAGVLFFVMSLNDKNIKFEDTYLVRLSEDKIIYEPKQSFARREMDSSNLSKIVDHGIYYVLFLKSKEQYVLDKSLLKNANIKEFEDFFEGVLVRDSKRQNNDETSDAELQSANTKNKIDNETDVVSRDEEESAGDQNKDLQYGKGDDVVVERVRGEEDDKDVVDTTNAKNKKFKKSLNRDEKSFKFAIIGVVLGMLALALSVPVTILGLNFAFNTIATVAHFLFSNCVVEFISFILSCVLVAGVSIVLVLVFFLATPALALLSLIFPIYQLVRVNRRWFSWVSLAFGILAVIGCIVLAFFGVNILAG